MKVKINDRQIAISWNHFLSKDTTHRVTRCTLASVQGQKIRVLANSYVETANVSKNVARKRSLAQALHMLKTSKEQRKEVWQGYLKMRRGKW